MGVKETSSIREILKFDGGRTGGTPAKKRTGERWNREDEVWNRKDEVPTCRSKEEVGRNKRIVETIWMPVGYFKSTYQMVTDLGTSIAIKLVEADAGKWVNQLPLRSVSMRI